MIINEDHRRILYEFGNGGDWKVAKYVEIKETCLLGNHYHKNKDELFLIIGDAEITLNGESKFIQGINEIMVKAGTIHTFRMFPKSFLICLATREHDPNDEIKA